MSCAEIFRKQTPLACLLLLACLVSQPAASRVCDVDDDGDIDRADVRLIFRAQNSSIPPGDPRDADGDGFVAYPRVSVVEELTNMMSASRSYEANLVILSKVRSMARSAMQIGR